MVQGCASQNSGPKKSILRKAEPTRLNASAGHTIKFSGRRNGPSRGVIQKGDLMSEILAPTFEERTLEKTSRQEECARKAA